MTTATQRTKRHYATRWSLTLWQIYRYVLLVIAPIVFWFDGSVLWDALHLSNLTKLTNPGTIWRLILPGFLTPQSLPSWLAYASAGLLLVLFAGCVWAVQDEARKVVISVQNGRLSEHHEHPSGVTETAPSVGTPKAMPSVRIRSIFWFFPVIGIIIVLVIRPSRTNLASFFLGTLITIGTALGLVVLAIVAVWVILKVRPKSFVEPRNDRTAIRAFSAGLAKGGEEMTSPATGITYVDALIIVDVQNDFCPGGSLAVPRGDEVVPVLNQYIAEASRVGVPIFASRDWHPQDTTHFARHDGVWPDHCIRGTWGALYHKDLELPVSTYVVSKGVDPTGVLADGYSAFDGTLDVGKLYKLPRVAVKKARGAKAETPDAHALPTPEEVVESNRTLRDTEKTPVSGLSLATVLHKLGVNRVYVGGLATDYCVKATVLSALEGGFTVIWLRDASLPVEANEGDGAKAEKELLIGGVNGGATAITIEQFSPISGKAPTTSGAARR